MHSPDWLSRWPLADSTSTPHLSGPGKSGWDWEFQSSNHLVGPLDNKCPTLVGLKVAFINITKTPLSPVWQKISRGLRAVSHEPWTKTKYIWKIYFGHLIKYICLIIHSITGWVVNNNLGYSIMPWNRRPRPPVFFCRVICGRHRTSVLLTFSHSELCCLHPHDVI